MRLLGKKVISYGRQSYADHDVEAAGDSGSATGITPISLPSRITGIVSRSGYDPLAG
jgi:hypothetical protein